MLLHLGCHRLHRHHHYSPPSTPVHPNTYHEKHGHGSSGRDLSEQRRGKRAHKEQHAAHQRAQTGLGTLLDGNPALGGNDDGGAAVEPRNDGGEAAHEEQKPTARNGAA